MEKEQKDIQKPEERILSYKEQIRNKEIEFRKLKQSLVQERKAFLRQIKEEIRQIRQEEKTGSLTKEEKEAMRQRKAELIAKKRKELRLPIYTQGEELMNAISHIVGGAFGIVATILGVYFAAVSPIVSDNRATAILCMAIYGFSMIFLYTMSSIYHFLGLNKAKAVFQILDHCTIYVLIAGTYIPVCVLMLAPTYPAIGYSVVGVVCFLAILGVVLNATMMRKKPVKVISHLLYIVIGWLIICFFPQLWETVGMTQCLLFLFGGIAYTIGAILYAIGRYRRYFHFIFHIFCLAGTILQFAGILLYFF